MLRIVCLRAQKFPVMNFPSLPSSTSKFIHFKDWRMQSLDVPFLAGCSSPAGRVAHPIRIVTSDPSRAGPGRVGVLLGNHLLVVTQLPAKLDRFSNRFFHLEQVDEAKLVLKTFWSKVRKLYNLCKLTADGGDFFAPGKKWLRRGDAFRILMEPLSIASWYKHGFHLTSSGHYIGETMHFKRLYLSQQSFSLNFRGLKSIFKSTFVTSKAPLQ